MKKMVTIAFLVAAILLASTRPGETSKKKIEVPVLCNKKNFNSSDEPQATAARDKVLGRLVGLTRTHPEESRFCTTTDVDDSSVTIYGLATCAKSFQDCSACLKRARNLLNQFCRSGSGGQINLLDQNPKCLMRYEKEAFCSAASN